MKPATTWKLLGGVFALLLLVMVIMLGRNRTGDLAPGQTAGGGETGALSGSRSRAALPPQNRQSGASSSQPDVNITESTETLVAGAANPSPGDGESTDGEDLDEEESETRARERYEMAQRNAYQFRKTDPDKIVATPVMPALTEASRKYNIPQEILVALMAVESGGAHRDADHSMEGGFGVMNLKENNLIDTLGEAASLIGKTKEEVLYDQGA